jgi:hypothetical protein
MGIAKDCNARKMTIPRRLILSAGLLALLCSLGDLAIRPRVGLAASSPSRPKASAHRWRARHRFRVKNSGG